MASTTCTSGLNVFSSVKPEVRGRCAGLARPAGPAARRRACPGHPLAAVIILSYSPSPYHSPAVLIVLAALVVLIVLDPALAVPVLAIFILIVLAVLVPWSSLTSSLSLVSLSSPSLSSPHRCSLAIVLSP
ncbi:hypothetical protein EW146_g9325 [Bondarzewia mesenterica]|uniref:Uncharacterized protein n=1 Tax=Bondarzewia mesenterica TaxID=1095465 RepID=A0A4S4L982_9AGAM|nr:hypothetical protein EW146_g9325 [Bondarzewia mesenterica]